MPIPERIGRFRVLELLGRGAMGIVFRGVDQSLDRQVALKVMAGQAEAEARARFKREAQAAARLQHPNIITVYELGEHEGAPFMALELLEGVDLQRAIEAGLRPDPRLTLPVVLQLVAGLGHAHERGIVHRDVKPSNLFLPRGRPAKIMDFGVARLQAGTTAAGGGLTRQGMVIGTPNYMSPEQVRALELDGRSDLFSAGLILSELVTGEKAYRGDSIVALLFKIAHEDPNLSLIPGGPRWAPLRRVVERALQRDPANRYPDAASMGADLLLAWHELGGVGDGTSSVDLGVRPQPALHAVELGTAGPALAPPMDLGTPPPEPSPVVAPEAPPVAAASESFAGPATGTQVPIRLALGLGLGAVVVLAGTAALLLRPAPVPAAAPAPVADPGPSPMVAAPAQASVPPSTAAPTRPRPTPAVAALPSPAAATASPLLTPAEAPIPDTPPQNARVDRAEQLLEAGRYAAALAEARGVLFRDPRNSEAQQVAEEAEAALLIESCLKKARAALARGDKDAALEDLRKGLAVNSNEARLLALWREATQ